jgi:hypothetical protein
MTFGNNTHNVNVTREPGATDASANPLDATVHVGPFLKSSIKVNNPSPFLVGIPVKVQAKLPGIVDVNVIDPEIRSYFDRVGSYCGRMTAFLVVRASRHAEATPGGVWDASTRAEPERVTVAASPSESLYEA